MAADAFTRIQQAESEAVNIVNAAKRESEAIIERAEREAAVIIANAVNKAREAAERRYSDFNRECQILRSAALDDLNKEKEAIINGANANRQAAIDKILEIIAG